MTGVRKTVHFPHGSDHTEDLLMSNLQTCWWGVDCQKCEAFADGKTTGDSRFSGVRGLGSLAERSDGIFSVSRFSADRE